MSRLRDAGVLAPVARHDGGWGVVVNPAGRGAYHAGVSTDADCLFCKIVAGETPAEVVRESERTLSFRDITPQAPTHVLVVPKGHHRDAPALAAADPVAMVEVVSEAALVAEHEGLGAFRLVFNTGADAGQSVFHTHAHVLGGRPLSWPPG